MILTSGGATRVMNQDDSADRASDESHLTSNPGSLRFTSARNKPVFGLRDFKFLQSEAINIRPGKALSSHEHKHQVGPYKSVLVQGIVVRQQ